MENFYESVYRDTSAACAAGRGVGEKHKEALSILQEEQKVHCVGGGKAKMLLKLTTARTASCQIAHVQHALLLTPPASKTTHSVAVAVCADQVVARL